MEQLSINNDMFAPLREQFDEMLNQTIANMMLKGTLEGSMSIKVNIGIVQDFVQTEDGTKEVLKPVFEHDISSLVQVKERAKGSTEDDYELVKNVTSDKWEVKRLSQQVSMFDNKEEEVTEPSSLFKDFMPYIGDDMTVIHSDDGGYEIMDTSAVRPAIIASARLDGKVTGLVGLKPEELAPYLDMPLTIVGNTDNGVDYTELSLVCEEDGAVFVNAYPE
ncbi:MAG: hypothetical protein LUE27_06720 [Clostridia bacterium]|nr:hypothetical protein [Clostridia bacterium]